MKRICLSFLAGSAIVLSVCLSAYSQERTTPLKAYFTALPLRGNTPEGALRESRAGTTVPLWSYETTTTVDDWNYTGMIMGGTPSGVTTNIPTYLVPLIVNMPDGPYSTQPRLTTVLTLLPV